MSRSYKKNPIVKEDRSHRDGKKEANNSIRSKLKQGVEIGNGSSYKKHFESWDICDCSDRCSKEQAIAYYNANKYNLQDEYKTLDEWLKAWKKWYKNK